MCVCVCVCVLERGRERKIKEQNEFLKECVRDGEKSICGVKVHQKLTSLISEKIISLTFFTADDVRSRINVN